MPRRPPMTAITAPLLMVRSYPINKIAGSVKTIPAAMDSPAEPVVWTMLFSRIVDLPRVLKKATASTAIGIEADTVRPILSARYTLEAANTMPRIAPRMTARSVSSAGDWLVGTYELKEGGSGEIKRRGGGGIGCLRIVERRAVR